METKKVTIVTLPKLFKKILNWRNKEDDSAIGSFLFGKLRIQVSRHNLTTSQRVMQLYKRRRAEGLCIQCGEKVKKINPRTKKLYRLCDYHREEIDHK
jgi:hypothetical protein